MDFAFLVHPRNIDDIIKNKPLACFVPKGVLKFLLNFLKPIYLTEIKVEIDNKIITGALISLTQMPDYLLEQKDKSFKKIVQGVNLAQKLGAKIIGLGSFTSPLTHGGLDLINQSIVKITNGNAYTAAVVIEAVNYLTKINNKSYNHLILAVVGATGSIGSAVSKILAAKFKKTILIARDINKLKDLKNFINGNNQSNLVISTKIAEIKAADLIILSTSHHQVLIKPSNLKAGTIIYDITQPSNLSPEIFKQRNDVLALTGGLVEIPGLNLNFDFGLPKGVYFACLAETILLSLERKFEDFSVGYVDIKKINEISKLAEKYNFKPAHFVSFGKRIKIEQIQEFFKIFREKN